MLSPARHRAPGAGAARRPTGSPMVWPGFSAVSGSCGIRAMSRPRVLATRRRTRGADPSMPWKRTLPASTCISGGVMPSTVRPTMLFARAGFADQRMHFTGRDPQVDAAQDQHARARRACRAQGARCRCSICRTVMAAWASSGSERLAQPVAQRVAGQHRDRDGGDRQAQQPGRLVHVQAALLHQPAPGRHVAGHRQADEGEDRLDHHRDAHLQREQREQQRHHVGQHLAPQGCAVRNCPRVRAEVTSSEAGLHLASRARTTRQKRVQSMTAMASTTEPRPVPTTATSTIDSSTAGNDIQMSTMREDARCRPSRHGSRPTARVQCRQRREGGRPRRRRSWRARAP